MKKLLPLIIILIMPGLPALAQEEGPQEFSLDEAVQYAIDNNATVKNAAIEVTKAKKDIKETVATGFPQINGQASVQKNFDIQTNLITFGGQEVEVKFGTEYNLSASINASQLVFDGTFFVGLKAARTYAELSQKELVRSEIETRLNVEKAYYAALVAGKNAEILNGNLEEIEQTLYETEELFKNGFVEELDVDRIRFSLINLQSNFNSVTREAELTYKLLKFQMGYPLEDSLILTENLDALEAMEFGYPENVNSFDPKERIEYKLANIREDLAFLNVRRYQSTYLPRLNIFAAHQQLAQREEFNFHKEGYPWYPSTYAGLQLSVPIFQGLGRSARIQKAKLDLEIIQNSKEQLVESFYLEIKQARKNYLNALENLNAQRQNLDLAEKILERTDLKYTEGVGSSLETSQARNDLYQAQITYINALFQFLNSKVELKKALAKY